MSTDYDSIAEEYKRAKLQPWRTHVEAYTFLKHIGDPKGKKVLDLACGDGFYSRILKSRGADAVTGVDLSEKMIALAKKQEDSVPLGIRYLTGDAKSLELPEQYDLVVAAYLLNYSKDRNDLAAMLSSISRILKPGGRFVTVNCNPHLDFRTAPSYRQYGFETAVNGEWREEAVIKWFFHLDNSTIGIENYHLSVSTHETACHEAGFHSVRWHEPLLDPAQKVISAPDYWSPLLKSPPLIFLECQK